MNLNQAASVTLDVSGNGNASIGPQNMPGTQSWHITGVILKTSRKGLAPVPSCEVYLDTIDPSNLQGVTYDGSFNQGACDITMIQGQRLIGVWTGGQLGDLATIVVSGTRGNND